MEDETRKVNAGEHFIVPLGWDTRAIAGWMQSITPRQLVEHMMGWSLIADGTPRLTDELDAIHELARRHLLLTESVWATRTRPIAEDDREG